MKMEASINLTISAIFYAEHSKQKKVRVGKK